MTSYISRISHSITWNWYTMGKIPLFSSQEFYMGMQLVIHWYSSIMELEVILCCLDLYFDFFQS